MIQNPLFEDRNQGNLSDLEASCFSFPTGSITTIKEMGEIEKENIREDM